VGGSHFCLTLLEEEKIKFAKKKYLLLFIKTKQVKCIALVFAYIFSIVTFFLTSLHQNDICELLEISKHPKIINLNFKIVKKSGAKITSDILLNQVNSCHTRVFAYGY
jgi:hypothetical protein